MKVGLISTLAAFPCPKSPGAFVEVRLLGALTSGKSVLTVSRGLPKSTNRARKCDPVSHIGASAQRAGVRGRDRQTCPRDPTRSLPASEGAERGWFGR